MRKTKRLMMAAAAAVSTLMVGAMPRPAAAETAAGVAAMVADVLYPVYVGGKLVGYFDGRTGQWVTVESSGPLL